MVKTVHRQYKHCLKDEDDNTFDVLGAHIGIEPTCCPLVGQRVEYKEHMDVVEAWLKIDRIDGTFIFQKSSYLEN